MVNSNGYEEKIAEFARANDSAMLADLERLMRIDSAYTEEGAGPGAPFGPGSAKALAECAEMLSGYGFPVKNYDNYVITADLGEGERELDILAHLDVVPGGEGWTVTPVHPAYADNGEHDDVMLPPAHLLPDIMTREKFMRPLSLTDASCSMHDCIPYPPQPYDTWDDSMFTQFT